VVVIGWALLGMVVQVAGVGKVGLSRLRATRHDHFV